ncbi:methyltransferase [Streptomyces mirabilis]|uniref:Type I restriction enzyme M protein n=1 Tax=Streptomyces mirabilis TaxID=68239 RepID=A0A1I2J023_9ACTN|nr:methyltransferase [Streptomyces mirabilis]SFF47193.1 type I restriction enzyme M protein [Streptomyces mirabilis]
MAAYRSGEPTASRVESEDENGPFKKFSYDDLIARDKVNLDITWMKDPALDDADSGLAPEVIAEEIVRDLQSALNEFAAIARSLGGEVDVPEAEVE